MRNEIVVFDLDDTLYNEIDFLKSAFREIADYCGGEGQSRFVYDRMLQWYASGDNVFEKVVDVFAPWLTVSDLLSRYRNHIPDICMSESNRQLLKFLKENGFVIGIITDGRGITQRNKIQALNLEKWVLESDIIISEEFGSAKPQERNYRFFMEKYPAIAYWYIGDNLRKDFVTAKQLGWKTVCLRDKGRNIHPQNFSMDKAFLPDFTVNALDEIKDFI